MLYVIALLGGLSMSLLLLSLGNRATLDPEARLHRHQNRSLLDLDQQMGRRAGYSGLIYPAPELQTARTGITKLALERLSGWLRPKLPNQYLQKVERQLVMAGSGAAFQPVHFVVLRLTAAVALPVLFYLLMAGQASALLMGAVAALGWVGPQFWLKRQITERQHVIQRALPNTVDLLTVSVEAGLGLDAAVARVADKAVGPLGDELRHYLRLVRMGTPRREAMRDLGERSGVPDLKTFATSIIQADQLGVSMGNVLRVQSEEMRRKRKQRAEEAAMKAPIKMLFPLVFCIFPAIFVVLLGPAAIQIVGAFMRMGSE